MVVVYVLLLWVMVLALMGLTVAMFGELDYDFVAKVSGITLFLAGILLAAILATQSLLETYGK